MKSAGASNVNDSPVSDANPYQGPSTEPNITTRTKRSVGTVIVAVLLLLSGLWVGGHRFYQLTLVLSADEVVVHPSYYVALTRDVISAVTAIGGAIGLIFGRTFGWWLSILHGFWRLAIQSVLPLLGAIASEPTANGASQSSPVSEALTAGVLFLLIILYLQKSNVLAKYQINGRRTMTNVGLFVFCVAVAFGLDIWWAITQR